jgi:hypothetical protein
MSLAFNASPFNSDNDYIDSKNGDTPITRKKQTNNKTQKRPASTTGNTDKVNALLASIHNSVSTDGDMCDFNPPGLPQSSGVENTIIKEHMTNLSSKFNANPNPNPNPNLNANPNPNMNSSDNLPHNPTQMFDDEVNMDGFNDKSYAEDYYRKMIPNYGKKTNSNATNMFNNRQQDDPPHGSQLNHRNDFYPQQPYNSPHLQGNNSDVIEKLNYMINLLEENHDERTGNVTEEVILYSFLGIFIIFIADSFARVGKYTR